MFAKPYDINELVAAINTLLEEKKKYYSDKLAVQSGQEENTDS